MVRPAGQSIAFARSEIDQMCAAINEQRGKGKSEIDITTRVMLAMLAGGHHSVAGICAIALVDYTKALAEIRELRHHIEHLEGRAA